MTVILPGHGRRVTALGSTYTTKAEGNLTNGAYGLVEEEFWGDTTPLHSHRDCEEAFYVLAGEVAVWLRDEEVVAQPGTFLVVPRGTPHALRRLGETTVRMLTLTSPPGLERFFDEVAAQGEEELLADAERLAVLAARFGIEILGDYPGT
jgi:mannose-6-phosphate isomerase-like protein (cupin superfamily)